MVIATGARGFIHYDFESSYATGASLASGEDGKRFGMQEKITSWTLNNSRINLATLNQTELEGYAYGQEQGSINVGFVLSNPWLFGAVYGAPVSVTSSAPEVHTFSNATANSTKDIRSFSTAVGLDFPTGQVTRTLKGCILRSFTIGTSIGSVVDCTADIGYSDEDAPDTSTALTAPVKPTTKFPYTFAHGTMKMYDPTTGGSGTANRIVAKIQSVNLTFNQNPDMLCGLGSHQSVEAFRKVFEVTGDFQASWVNTTLLSNVLNQVKAGTGGLYEETVADAPNHSGVELELEFSNGLAGASRRTIKITLTGVSPTEHSISGIEPVEPVFESITWQAKSAVIVAENAETAEP